MKTSIIGLVTSILVPCLGCSGAGPVHEIGVGRRAVEDGLALSWPKVPDELDRALRAFDERICAVPGRRKLSISPSGIGAVLVADSPADGATGRALVWADWRRPAEMREIADIDDAEFVGPAHVQLRGLRSQVVDIRHTEQPIVINLPGLDTEGVVIAVDQDGHWAAKLPHNEVRSGTLADGISVTASREIEVPGEVHSIFWLRDVAVLVVVVVTERADGYRAAQTLLIKSSGGQCADPLRGGAHAAGPDGGLLRSSNGYELIRVDENCTHRLLGRLRTDPGFSVHYVSPLGRVAVGYEPGSVLGIVQVPGDVQWAEYPTPLAEGRLPPMIKEARDWLVWVE